MTTATSSIGSTTRSLKAVDLHSRARIQIQMAWTASLVLVALVTVTNIAAQLAFSRRKR